jgi:UDP-N-acetylmuramate--alanine ligase
MAKKIYMIGIKGVGMTMLAQYLSGQGVRVSGSDTPENYMTDQVLKDCKVTVRERFEAGAIPKDADLIVYSTAYTKENNEEVAAALAGKTKTLPFPAALALVFNQKYGIAVTGTHGKTTTTAWLGFVLREAGLSPTVMAGAAVPQLGGSCAIGTSELLVAELDEYQNKLAHFWPKAVLLNNIDYDHPDFFPTREAYRGVFIEFLKKIPASGWIVANFDDPVIRSVAAVNCRGKVVSYAIAEAADYVAYDIKAGGGRQYFKVKMAPPESGDRDEVEPGEIDLGEFNITLSGRHNVLNALAVVAAAVELGASLADIRGGLAEFTGAARRLQILGEYRGVTIMDDYAHHPAEIKATLKGAREMHPGRRLSVVFHPHTYTRTLALFDDFARSFGLADRVIVLDIYGSAREKQGGVHSKDLAERIKANNERNSHTPPEGAKQEVIYIPTLEECENYLRENVESGEIVILMGAGDVFRIGERLISHNS